MVYLLWVLAAIIAVWLASVTLAAVIVYSAVVLDRWGTAWGMSNCLFFALRKFLGARREADRYKVALVLQWSPRYWGPHVWFARRVQGQWVEEFIPKHQRSLVPPTMIFRGRVRRRRLH